MDNGELERRLEIRRRRRERERARRRRLRRRRLAAAMIAVIIAVSLAHAVSSAPGADTPAAEGSETAGDTEHTEQEIALTTASPPPPVETEEEHSRYYSLEETLTEEDVYTLACLVYHEARGEPFEGQVAVVEVVFNRVLSDRFPNTIQEVVFQKYGKVWQFSPAPYLYTAEPEAAHFNAVWVALRGLEYHTTLETVYYSTKPYNDKISAVIGNHYFCEI